MKGGANVAVLFWTGLGAFALLPVQNALMTLGVVGGALALAFLARHTIEWWRNLSSGE